MTYNLLAVLLTTCMMAFQPAADKYLDLTGEIAGKDSLEVTLVRDPYGSTTVLAKDTLRGGRFHIRCRVDEVTPVSIVYREGRMRKSFTLILEEGKVQFSLRPSELPQLKGGKYNTWLFGYQHDPEFLRVDAALWKERQELAVQPDSVKEWESIQHFMQRNEMRSKYLRKILHNGKDPLAAVLAAVLLELQPEPKEAMAIVEKAIPVLGEKNYNIEAARKIHASIRQQLSVRKGLMTGQPFVDFTAADVHGDSLHMGAVVRRNRYTLLQFWASWCVPCRAEIPQLKSLYATYQGKGLEIVSFSMDNNPVSWKKASEQEKMNWPNVSDLKAQKSPVVTKYPVNGVPANVIIDQKGMIVASNIFGEELESKMKALFP